MADEIDIEEHDVLDNPMIRKIFPDLSVIKHEISQYEGGLDIQSEPMTEVVSPNVENKFEHASATEDKKLLGSPDFCGAVCRPIKNEKCFSNVIILGSKPDISSKQKIKEICFKSKLPKVMLENINSYLGKCKTYCKHCLILYPNISALKLHIKFMHLNNKYDINNHKSLSSLKSGKTKYKCDLCSIYLSSQFNLIRHLKNIHQKRGDVDEINRLLIRKENEDHTDSHDTNSNSPTNMLDQSHTCFHCQQSFPTQNSLVEHLYSVLEPKKNRKKTECKTCKCYFTDEESFKKHKSTHDKNKVSDTFKYPDESVHHSQYIGTKKVKLITEGIEETIVIEQRKTRSTVIKEFDPAKIDSLDERKRKTSEKLQANTIIFDDHYEDETNIEKLEEDSISNIHDEKTSNTNSNNNKKKSKKYYDKKILVENAYKCPICSRYDFTFNLYAKHMTKNHNVKEVSETEKEIFDSQCIFCTSKLVNLNSYNGHLARYHKEKLSLDYRKVRAGNSRISKIKNEIISKTSEVKCFAFKSVLYKCGKCDIHFLNATSALNHSEHMEILINWKCLICNRILKKVDKFLHVKQHSYSHAFTVYELYETTLNRVLYNCPKCAIHFSESSYLRHYSKCGKETSSSAYCKVCDILVNQCDYELHDEIHKTNNLRSLDFTIVDGNFVLYEETDVNIRDNDEHSLVSNDTNCSKQIIHDKSRFLMTFCHICECFMSTIGSTRKVHIEARCTHLQRRVCRECGLVFTNQTIRGHKLLHSNIKGLSVQNYFFYDLKSKKQICPPIPQYPSCKVCGIHFLTKNDVIGHECNGFGYVICQICQIKFSETALKLHLQFHQYSMKKSQDLITSKIPDSESIVDKINFIGVKKPSLEPPNEYGGPKLLYLCKSCRVTFDEYDHVVKHCQTHYDHTKPILHLHNCQYCSLTIDQKYCNSHKEMHSSRKYGNKSVKVLNFDPIYYPLENNVWMKHIYGSLPDDTISSVVNESIYRFECRLKIEIKRHGISDPTFYRCDKCLAFVDSKCVYNHAVNLQCNSLRKHPCKKCGMCFVSINHKITHEKCHENRNFSIKSSRLVKFNMVKDQTFHNTIFKSCNQFILYQCRNCNLAMDKFQREFHKCDIDKLGKCLTCGLLVREDDNELHNTRHEELANFNSSNIVVVLFGKELNKENKKIKPSFNGTINDYTFYKCKQCKLCLRTKDCTFKHKCAKGDSKYQCPKCYLFFMKQEMASHTLLHDTDSELVEYNLNIITFDIHSNENNDTHQIILEKHPIASVLKNKNYSENSPEKARKSVYLYKCDCGLHFLDDTKLKTHISYCWPKMKISKQKCSKCGLLFTPEELFNHLLAHHADKKQDYKFEITCFSKHDNVSEIYKCEKCNIHFLKESEIYDHLENCDETEAESCQECSKCGLIIHKSSFLQNNHEKECEGNYITKIVNDTRSKETLQNCNVNKTIDTIITDHDMVYAPKYDFSREILSKLDLSKYTNVIYKCDVCNVCYLTESTWITHLRSNDKYKHSAIPTDYCNICGQNFSLPSLTKHKYIHHDKFDLKNHEFVIKTSTDNEN